jgi:hypothetical protein
MGYCMLIPIRASKVNEYLDHQWYDHINIMKNGQLLDVAIQDEYVVL